MAKATDTSWMRKARCADEDAELFFKDVGQGSVLPTAQIEQAKTICHRCDVREECLEYAMRNDIDHGIWGGLVPKERQRLRRKRRNKG